MAWGGQRSWATSLGLHQGQQQAELCREQGELCKDLGGQCQPWAWAGSSSACLLLGSPSAQGVRPLHMEPLASRSGRRQAETSFGNAVAITGPDGNGVWLEASLPLHPPLVTQEATSPTPPAVPKTGQTDVRYHTRQPRPPAGPVVLSASGLICRPLAGALGGKG